MTQTAGTNITTSVILGGYATSYYSGSTPTAGPTPGTYNLRGGVFQTGLISGSTYWNINDSQDDPTPAYFNFTAGTLQALSGGVGVGGLNLTMTMTVGTAASNVATLDANGQLVNLNSEGLAGIGFLTGLGQLRVIDSVGGGKVVLGGSDFSGNSLTNNYSGGTTVLSGTLQVVNNQSLPTVGVLTVGGPGAAVQAVFDLNGQQVTTQGLVTASSLVNPDLNFQTPGVDLLTIGSGGMNIAPNTAISFGTKPTAAADYR